MSDVRGCIIPLSSDSEQTVTPPEPVCSLCGRYVGEESICPYCDSPVISPMPLRALRRVCLLLATAGLFLLYLMVLNKEPPTVRIDEVAPTMNYAYVRITGTVVLPPRTNARHGRTEYISFRVDDGTGTILVCAYDSRAQAIVESGRLPQKGDTVELSGTVSVQEGRRRFYIETAEHVRILQRADKSK